MRMNRDVIRTIAKLILGRDMEEPMDITANELKSEDKKMLILNEQALLFYSYLNRQSDEFLEENDFDKEKIKEGLMFIAKQYGIVNIVNMLYF